MFRKIQPIALNATVVVDGVPIEAVPGEPVAAVLLRTATPHARVHSVTCAPRGPYCMMGVCHDCCAIVDGAASTQTCLIAVRDGMVVVRQNGPREPCDE